MGWWCVAIAAVLFIPPTPGIDVVTSQGVDGPLVIFCVEGLLAIGIEEPDGHLVIVHVILTGRDD